MDGVGQKLVPLHSGAHDVAAVAVGGRPPRHGARHRERRDSTPDGNGGAKAREVALAIGGGRGAARGVEAAERSARGVVDQPHVVAADPVHVRVDHGDRRGGGDRGIEGVAAALKHRDAGLGGQPMGCGDETVRRARVGPGGRGRHAAYPTTPLAWRWPAGQTLARSPRWRSEPVRSLGPDGMSAWRMDRVSRLGSPGPGRPATPSPTVRYETPVGERLHNACEGSVWLDACSVGARP